MAGCSWAEFPFITPQGSQTEVQLSFNRPGFLRRHQVLVRRIGSDDQPPPTLPRGGRFEIAYVETGEGRQRIGAHTYQATAGDLFLIAPWEVRHLGCQHGLNVWVVAFEAEDQSLAAFLQLQAAGERSLTVEAAHRAGWISRFRSLAEELATDSLGCDAAAQALLKLLLVDVARLAGLRFAHQSRPSRPILLGVFSYIEQRFRAPIGLADVAKAVARSPSYLTDLVRRETGRTVQQWIIHRRMTEARLLLLESGARVKDIGSMIGYDDTGHFIRQFRRANGLTPHRWRLGA